MCLIHFVKNNSFGIKIKDCVGDEIFFTGTVCIYIYIYIIKKKTQTDHIRIINLFPSCYVFLIGSALFGKFQLKNISCPNRITPNSSLTGPNNTTTHTHTHTYIEIIVNNSVRTKNHSTMNI